MDDYIPFIGDKVYIYSISLNEVIEGILEGYADESGRRYKVLQYMPLDDGHLRHIVSHIYVFESYEEALRCKEEYRINSNIEILSGNIVYLLDRLRQPISDKGVPCEYQIVAVYKDTRKVGLVTTYGEYIGLHSIEDTLYVGEGPIFNRADYEIGTKVIWTDHEEVYEGIIQILHEATATITDVKKLMPIDYKIRIPYWKIPEGRKSYTESTPVLHTIIGDDLD